MTIGKSVLPVVLAFVAISAPAHAQRYRNYPVKTAAGPVSMPEWRQSGGNIMVYQQIMEQKAMIQQEQAYAKMVQQQQKWDQQAAKSSQTSAASTSHSVMALPTQTRARKKRHGIDESKVVAPDTKAKPATSKVDATKPKDSDENP